jgi:uncharacterized protein
MHRRELPADHGMLFSYPRPDILRVWMKNTLINLDVLFLDAEGRINGLLPNLPPCRRDPCPIYHSPHPAQYMLEVNGGYLQQHPLRPGQRLTWPTTPNPAR